MTGRNGRDTLYLALPVGPTHGWGICGRYIAREMARLTTVRLITDPFQTVGNEMEDRFLQTLLPPASEFTGAAPLLQGITGKDLMPCRPDLRGRPQIGYTFFEENILPAESIGNARAQFDVVVTGSSWCKDVLEAHGLENVSTIVQGIDPQIFHPTPYDKDLFSDRFVVFSGGKFEFRKGQDLAIRAYKVLQDRHPDVMLVHSWYNPWSFSLDTMRSSPYIRFAPSSTDYFAAMNQVLNDNGIDVSRVIALPPRPNALMAQFYRQTDVGLFPNRCEGGTNLVLMEYMACGKPVVASWSTGHKDILTGENAILIRNMGRLHIRNGESLVAVWDDPNLEETIEQLEWAYRNREKLKAIGRQAGEDLQRFTWAETARQFLGLLRN
ncbi:MAG: glycosyltransferase family 4 protein [Bryobacteraceae bacterium]|nr:glycosyltransferase family 4 protein [Bryobacteraceae bacterium]